MKHYWLGNVPADFARQLERELAEARANRAYETDVCTTLRSELEESIQQRDECERQFQTKVEELIRVMEQCDRLAEALEYLCGACDGIDCADFMPAAMPDAYLSLIHI